jgi:serine/threonine-protein kinase
MDWSDLREASGRVVAGHRLGERLDDRVMRTQRIADRRSGRFWLLDADAALAEELAAGITAPPDRAILPILASGMLADGVGYLITSDPTGPSLDDLLEDGPVEPSRAVAILRRLAMAYRALHATGRVLLDLRPRDIVVGVGFDDAVFVPGHPALVGAPVGRRMGGYCAPDVVFDDVDPRADQFTLGVIGFELLTGTTPHNPDAPPGERTMMPAAPLQGVPEGLSTLIQRLLSDERGGRYGSMTEVQEALDVLAGMSGAPTYGHYTPVLTQRRAHEPVYLGADEPYDDDELTSDSVWSFLFTLVGAWALALALSVLIFWLW